MPASTRPFTNYDVLGLLVAVEDALARPGMSDARCIRQARLVLARFKARHIDGANAATLADWQRDGVDAAARLEATALQVAAESLEWLDQHAAQLGSEAPIRDAGARVIAITTATAIEPGPPIGLQDDTDEATRAAARRASDV